MDISYNEKNIYVTLFATLLVTVLYFFKVYSMHKIGLFDGADGFKLIGKSVLVLIGVMALINIIFQFFYSIFLAPRINKCRSQMTDERDQIIEVKGMQVSYAIVGTGLILSMIALWQGISVFWVVNTFVFSLIFGEIIGNCKKLFLYQKGF